MAIPKVHKDKYTYADYLTWPEDERWEIIDGVAYYWNAPPQKKEAHSIDSMSPAPSRKHQAIVRNLTGIFAFFLKDKPCKAYPAPFDVRLANMHVNNNNIETVVQPDISIFCDPSKLDDRGANGVPDMVIEVLSDSTRNKDLSIKLLLYQKFGVKEYWIIDPSDDTIYVYKPASDGKYQVDHIYNKEEILKVGIFNDLSISVKDIFEM
jgi:Uma2 family endonuclease